MNHTKKITLLVAMTIIGFQGWAQQKFQLHSDSEVLVNGTSTLHDWSSKVNEMEGSAVFNDEFLQKGPSKNLKAAETIELKFVVNSIKGGRGDTMDRKIVTAFKGAENPFIVFKSDQPAVITSLKEEGSFELKSPGTLSMAGVSKPVEIVLEGKKTEEGFYHFKGSKPLNMKDYEMEPPSAMFGQIVTGEEVTVVFDLKMNPASGQ